MGVSVPMTTTEIVITQRITVDSEIADEIVWLNANDVRTEGSCSGHGIVKPTALIKPSSADKARELGYTPWLVDDLGLYEIKLRGQVPEPAIACEDYLPASGWHPGHTPPADEFEKIVIWRPVLNPKSGGRGQWIRFARYIHDHGWVFRADSFALEDGDTIAWWMHIPPYPDEQLGNRYD